MFFPASTFWFTDIPPPVPVPIITPKTTGWPFPAPSTASDKAKQFASFSKLTCLLSSFSRSFLKGLPFNHIELAFFTKAESVDTQPGIPIPTDLESPKSVSKFFTIEIMPPIVPS